MTGKAAKKYIYIYKKIRVAAFKCVVMDRFPPPATVYSALQESSSGQHKSLYLSLIHRMITKGDRGFSQCLGLKTCLATFWFCSDLYMSGDENLESLKITAIIMGFYFVFKNNDWLSR